MQGLRNRMQVELESGILPFWLKYAIDEEFGGFRGHIANDRTIDRHAAKGVILNARILWTFAKAFSVYGDPVYLDTARRAYEYLIRSFWDNRFGGVYWLVDHLGSPLDTKKRTYAQAFTIYALAEYAQASGDSEVLARALRLMEVMESSTHDDEHGGYLETYERDWTLAEDQRLSDADQDEKKSMNTQLHVLEAYSNMLRHHDHPLVRRRLKEIILLFLERIVNPATVHFHLFFDEGWHPRSDKISFGHDIEGSWLLCEAAGILGDAEILSRVRAVAVNLAQAVLDEGIDTDGGLFYEAGPAGILDSDKHWWPQAEAVVGFLNAFELSGETHFLHAAQHSWEFIQKHIIDREHGEWFWLVSKDGVPDQRQGKVGPWKCPYHNSRASFEAMARLDRLTAERDSVA